jgi:hypothetical protein
MKMDSVLSQDDLNGWSEKDALIRGVLEGVLPAEGIEWVVADMKRRYDACPQVQDIKPIFTAIQQGDHLALRAAILAAVQEAINPWVMSLITLEVDLYRTLASSKYAGRA